MLRMFITLLLGLVLSSVTPAWSAESKQWVLKREVAGIKIHQKPASDGYALTRGELTVEASIAALMTVIEDRSTCPRWVYACKHAHMVRQYNQTERLDYTVIDSPLLFADRDMYIYSQTRFNQHAKTLTIRLSGRENHDTGQPNRVRIKAMHGFWQLQEKPPGITKITYQIHSNPQLPASVVLDGYMVESVFQTLKQLRVLSKVTQPRPKLLIPLFGGED